MPRQVKCPRCSTINTVADGAKPICANCGFGSPAGGYPAAAPAQAAQMGAQAGFQAQAQAPYAAYGPPKRPGLVTAVSVIGFIVAGFAFLAGLLLAVLGSTIAAAFESAGYPGVATLGTTLFVVIGVLVVGFGVLQLFVALNILKGRNWARIVQTVLSGLSVLNGIFNLPDGVLGLAINVFVIVALFLPASNAFFAASKVPAGPYGQPAR